MSVASEQDTTGLHDPLHDAPRRLRERPEPRIAAVEDAQGARDNKGLEAAVGRILLPRSRNSPRKPSRPEKPALAEFQSLLG
jgi:hypothetical protein